MERNYAIDFIKFFAIFAVVVIHTFPLDSQIGLFILDNLSRFAVPFFFVASGYLFGIKILNTRESVVYFKRYVIKIVKIYVCWLIFYTIYDVLVIYLSDLLKNTYLFPSTIMVSMSKACCICQTMFYLILCHIEHYFVCNKLQLSLNLTFPLTMFIFSSDADRKEAIC
ncbi:acyltransferase family protein [Bacillus sp. V2I10]|uniref:acyltransferase family protein n=1 Tax=Bacillus sp. V2I10 TaxID=3042276 RepID=UPI00278218FE|nr:peptidoglycan/LPS O-acetylase OafA/YrhL [Bacillus sp. V2I10]